MMSFQDFSFPVPKVIEAETNDDLRLILTSVYRAGQYAVKTRKNRNLEVKTKSALNFVTVVDTDNQNFLVGEFQNLSFFKSTLVGFVLEENTKQTQKYLAKGGEDILIYIDPIDGTTAFKEGGDDFCVGVSVEKKNGELLYAVVYIPARDKMYCLGLTMSSLVELDFVLGDSKRKEINVESWGKDVTNPRVATHYNHEKKDELLKIYSIISGRKVRWYAGHGDRGSRYGDNSSPGSLMIDMIDLVLGKYDLVINGNAHLWDIAPVRHFLKLAEMNLVDWQSREIDVSVYKGQDRPLQLFAGSPIAINWLMNKLGKI